MKKEILIPVISGLSGLLLGVILVKSFSKKPFYNKQKGSVIETYSTSMPSKQQIKTINITRTGVPNI